MFWPDRVKCKIEPGKHIVYHSVSELGICQWKKKWRHEKCTTNTIVFPLAPLCVFEYLRIQSLPYRGQDKGAKILYMWRKEELLHKAFTMKSPQSCYLQCKTRGECTSPLTTDASVFACDRFHCGLFTLQHPGRLRSTDPLPQLLTGADEVVDE